MSAPLATPDFDLSVNTSPRIPSDHYSPEVKFELSSKSSVKPAKPKIPDGGWGWMVVLSSLVLSMIQDGISFSFGILYVEFKKEFGASSSATSWIGSLFLSVPLLTGPIMSVLVDKYGCRNMTILGGLISATGFVVSSFGKSIAIMYITFGVLAGLGLGLTYITAVVSIAFWFDKKRNTAVGLGACGTGIGTFVYAPFTTFLLAEFGWRWTVRLLAGTLLNICVCGALMRDPDWIIEQDKDNKKSEKTSSKCSTLSLAPSNTVSTEKLNLEDVRSLLKNGGDAEFILQTLATSVHEEDKAEALKQHTRYSVLNIPTFIKQNETIPLEVLEKFSQNERLYKVILENQPSLLHCRSSSEKGLNKLDPGKLTAPRVPVTVAMTLRKKDSAHRRKLQYQPYSMPEKAYEPLLQKKTLMKQMSLSSPPQNYFKNMRFPRHSLMHRAAVLNKHKYIFRASSCPNIFRVSMADLNEEEIEEPWYVEIVSFFREFSFSLFFELHFFLNALATVILFAWFMTPYFYLADHMEMAEYTKSEASYVMSCIGITNTIGMVTLGWAGDQEWCNVMKTYAFCLILCGVCCSALMIFTFNYYLLMISAGFYGFFLASSFSFTPIVLVEMLPLETFTKAYGLNLLCQGIGHLGGPPIAGLLFDYTGTWDSAFHLSGVWIVVSGLLIVVIPYTRNRKIIGSGLVEKDLALERELKNLDV